METSDEVGNNICCVVTPMSPVTCPLMQEEHDYEDLDDLRSELSHQPFLSQSTGALNSPNKVYS